MMIKYRVNEVAKDLGVTSKEIIEVLSKVNDTPHKSQTALTEGELNAIFEKYTQTRQVENFDAYFAQADEKPEPPKPAVKPAEPAVQQAKPAPAAAPAVQAVKQPATPAAAAKPAASAAPAPQPQQQPAAQQRPAARQQAPAQQSVPNGRPAPQFRPNTNRPPVGGAQGGNRPPYQGNRPQQGGQQQGRPQQGGQFQQNRPGNRPPYQGGQQRGGFQQGGRPGNNQPRTPKQPKPTYQRPAVNPAKPAAPLMVDEQGNKGRDVRVVDMRTSQVNLDKYNEKYERIAPTNFAKDNIVKKQKLNQRSAQRGKPNYSRREQEMLKMRKLEMERQRRQKLEITLPDEITVGDLALKLKIQAAEIIKKLFILGIMATINQEIDYDTCSLIAADYGIELELNIAKTAEDVLNESVEEADSEENLVPRPPVVTIMGHVDHGKTSLLDAFRESSITAGEAGGITQHIGAYTVSCKGRTITFIDTPGHEAFTSMRARGAQVTDIVILVVAADDGIMPQTIEAINHAKAANVPIIVAINKIDKDTANPDRVIQQLTEYGLVAEEWGGDTICVPVSAKKRINLDTLLEMVLLQADVLELKANPDRAARGTIIEAELDKGRGPVATVLVQNGTLKIGDPIVAGTAFGRVRAMMDDKGRRVTSAGPSQPVEVRGFGEVPSAGDVMNVAEVDKLSRQVAEERRDKLKAEQIRNMSKVSLDDLFSQIEAGNVKDLNIIVKADVQGTVEAIKQALEKLSNDEVRVRCIHGGVGAITGSDIVFASASNALVIGFNVRPDATAREAAEREKVDVRTYSVIYNVIEDVENAMKGLFAPVYKEVALGTAEVRNTFKVSGVGTIAGAYVKDGKITRSAQVRVVRGGIVLHDGKIASLKRFKDDVKEVASGYECGIGIENFNDIREGDMIEAYTMEQIER